MTSQKYIQLKDSTGAACIPVSAARYLTIGLPQLNQELSEVKLHLQVKYSLDNVSNPLEAQSYIDTVYADEALKVSTYTGKSWQTLSSDGIEQDAAGQRILVDMLGLLSESYNAYIYYCWYYLDGGITIHVTPWASTKLTATSGIPKHSELQDLNSPDQHPIEAITGLSEALSREYFELPVKTDADIGDLLPAEGKLITFLGYSTGEESSTIVWRYRTASGKFGNIGEIDTDYLDVEENTDGDMTLVVLKGYADSESELCVIGESIAS